VCGETGEKKPEENHLPVKPSSAADKQNSKTEEVYISKGTNRGNHKKTPNKDGRKIGWASKELGGNPARKRVEVMEKRGKGRVVFGIAGKIRKRKKEDHEKGAEQILEGKGSRSQLNKKKKKRVPSPDQQTTGLQPLTRSLQILKQ